MDTLILKNPMGFLCSNVIYASTPKISLTLVKEGVENVDKKLLGPIYILHEKQSHSKFLFFTQNIKKLLNNT